VHHGERPSHDPEVLSPMIEDHLHRIWGLALKEFQQLARDRVLLAFLVLGPIIELLLMGSLSGGGVHNLRLAVVDQDRTRASRELIAKLDRTDELRLERYASGVEQAKTWMLDGQVDAIAIVPPGYGTKLSDPAESAQVQLVADGSNHVVSAVAIGTAEEVAVEIGRDLGRSQPRQSTGPVRLRFIARFNEALEDRPHAITAMLGIVVFEVALVVAAQSIAREREMGTLEQLRVTPLARLDLMLGKAIPTLVVALVDFLIMMGLAVLVFDIPVRGSLLLLTVLTVPFVIVQIGWGTLISLVSHTQQQAMLFVFALAMVEVAFSGFLVPGADMPAGMRTISNASSLQHYFVILRGIALRGATITSLWRPSAALLGLSIAIMSVAWLRLRMGLDSDLLRRQMGVVWRTGCRWCQTSITLRRRKKQASRREWGREVA